MSATQDGEMMASQKHPEESDDDSVSAFDIARVVIRYWRQIFLGMAVGGAVAAIPVLFKPYAYKATASFIPQGGDAGKAGISAIAGAFGISVPGGNLSQSSQFYADLLNSRAVLLPILDDTFTVPELQGVRRTIPELLELKGLSPERTTELAVQSISSAITPSVNKPSGTVLVSVTTPWRSFSLALLEAVLRQVNQFNLRTRQTQASDERRFIEGRLSVARMSLQASEERFGAFLRGNRVANSPELVLIRDRMQRDVDLNQQVVTSLSQALEDARIREVRDVPVITIIEPPVAQTRPASRGRVKRGLTGVALGGLLTIVLAFYWDTTKRRLAAGDSDLLKYQALLDEFRRGLTKNRGGRMGGAPG